MSRKSTSFAQLYDYMNRSENRVDGFLWNLYGYNRTQRLHAFYQNASHLRSHARGNILYHEILSFKRCSSASLERQQKALYDLAHKYLASRGKHLLGYGRIHLEKEHIHMHLMLSSNGLHQSNRHRLSKADFRAIQQQCEQYIQQAYPDLQQKSVYSPHHTKEKPPQKEQRSSPTMTHVRNLLTELLDQERNGTLGDLLKQHGFELYQRGSTYGVSYYGKKYRLSTLGLDDAFHTAMRQASPSTDKKTPITKDLAQVKRHQELDDLAEYYQQIDQDLDSPEL